MAITMVGLYGPMGGRRTPAINTRRSAADSVKLALSADYLFTVCYCHLSRRILSESDSSFYSEILKYATRISVCVIAVSKSQEFLLKVRRRFIFFSTTTQGIRLRRRVDVFFYDVVH